MKFNKTFEDSLEKIPSDWKPFLIQYKSLKKCIKKIVLELNAKGLSQIMADKNQRIEYSLECYKPECTFEDGPVHVRPCIKVCPSCFGQTSKECLYVKKYDSSSSSPFDLPKYDNMALTPLADYETHHMENSLNQFSSVSCIELEADGEFFVTLLEDIYKLNCLQKQNQDKFLINLKNIQQMLIEVTSPFKKDIYTWRKIFQIYMEYKIFVGNTESDREERSWEFAQRQLTCFIDRINNSHLTSPFKKDIYTWRKIFQIYMEYKIFVGNTESDREERSWEFAQRQLTCFIDRINNSHLVKKLKNPLSKIAYENFMKLNISLVLMKKFQYFNQLATSKIIKKHDKKTSLFSGSMFRDLIEKYFLTENTFKSLCCAMEQLTIIIPQIDDYNCPICLNIAWKPIRLCCSHVFCVRCLVKSIRKGMRNCPICRAKDAVYKADKKNLDICLTNFLELYFPREVYKKQTDDDRERVAEEVEALTGLRIEERQTCVLL
ncbi:SPX domain-containing protein [Gigaspora margarita]|uniref:SPX domain-containing protein n=1 Tax=Gigaspora margarita TaxID=4874 RepID=A0A8H4B292_GIGMA|nr:SPX domain-containing protein [Gigaspora margarita]